ncbi:MAG: DUF4271 domain-containing protein [Bacteroidaceae bacterium]|nr:DUF4271 domain-containing protein [Bacteroidaceae bacterium]
MNDSLYHTRPDTFCVSGGDSCETVGGTTETDFTQGFFHQNPLMHTEVPYRSPWHHVERIPYRLTDDNLIIGSLLLYLVILVAIIVNSRNRLAQQAKDFFFTQKEQPTHLTAETGFERYVYPLAIGLLCLIGGLFTFAYVRYGLGMLPDPRSDRQLLAIYAGCFAGYFVIKWLFSSFINWIFFSKPQQKNWTSNNRFLFIVESISFFPLVTVVVFLQIPFEKSILISLCLVLIVKILLSFKTQNIFFPKIYGCFHLFAYLCTLELMPIACLWKVLALVTRNL